MCVCVYEQTDSHAVVVISPQHKEITISTEKGMDSKSQVIDDIEIRLPI